jgi:predicted ATP-dependent endonuclease of OLD family
VLIEWSIKATYTMLMSDIPRGELPAMQLEQIRVQNFRSCYDTTVKLSDHLTLLVGENDAGMSNLIDALRVSVAPATGRATLWFDSDRDLSYGAVDDASIVIKRTYSELTADQDAGRYLPVCPAKMEPDSRRR